MKPQKTLEFPVNDDIAQRWSGRAFTDEPLSEQMIGQLVEAFRWAPSCFNEQPWRLAIGRRGDAQFDRIASALMQGNGWAKQAAALIVTVAKTHFTQTNEPNKHAWHDVGLAAGQMGLQATSLGLNMHQMAGFDPDKIREVLQIPQGFEPVTVIAVGHRGQPDTLEEPLKSREIAAQKRKSQAEIIYDGHWH